MIFSCFLDGLGLPTAGICTSGALHTLESAYDSKARAPFQGDKIIIPFGNMMMNCMSNGEIFPALLLKSYIASCLYQFFSPLYMSIYFFFSYSP